MFEPVAGAHGNASFVRQINNAAVIDVEPLARGINPNGGPHRGRASAARDFKRRVHHRIRVARFPAEKQVVIILFYVPPIGGVISGLNREEKFLPVFVRFDVEAPIGAPKIVATVPVLGEAFAHDSFAKSTKLARPSVLAHDITPLEVQGAGVALLEPRNLPAHPQVRKFE